MQQNEEDEEIQFDEFLKHDFVLENHHCLVQQIRSADFCDHVLRQIIYVVDENGILVSDELRVSDVVMVSYEQASNVIYELRMEQPEHDVMLFVKLLRIVETVLSKTAKCVMMVIMNQGMVVHHGVRKKQ